MLDGVRTGEPAERWTVAPDRLQLYDLRTSKLETPEHDRAAAEPEVVRALVATLARLFGADGVGRSRPPRRRTVSGAHA